MGPGVDVQDESAKRACGCAANRRPSCKLHSQTVPSMTPNLAVSSASNNFDQGAVDANLDASFLHIPHCSQARSTSAVARQDVLRRELRLRYIPLYLGPCPPFKTPFGDPY